MKTATFMGPGQMTITEAPKPTIEKPTDAVVRIIRACVCGSDLWWYRGISKRATFATPPKGSNSMAVICQPANIAATAWPHS